MTVIRNQWIRWRLSRNRREEESPLDRGPPGGYPAWKGCSRPSQEALDLIAEAGVDPTDGYQEEPQDDEADDAGEGVQIAQVPEEELQRADQKQRQTREAEDTIAQGEA